MSTIIIIVLASTTLTGEMVVSFPRMPPNDDTR